MHRLKFLFIYILCSFTRVGEWVKWRTYSNIAFCLNDNKKKGSRNKNAVKQPCVKSNKIKFQVFLSERNYTDYAFWWIVKKKKSFFYGKITAMYKRI